jgi:hypothetical protein
VQPSSVWGGNKKPPHVSLVWEITVGEVPQTMKEISTKIFTILGMHREGVWRKRGSGFWYKLFLVFSAGDWNIYVGHAFHCGLFYLFLVPLHNGQVFLGLPDLTIVQNLHAHCANHKPLCYGQKNNIKSKFKCTHPCIRRTWDWNQKRE